MHSVRKYSSGTLDPTILVIVGFFSSIAFIFLLATTGIPGGSETTWFALPTFSVTSTEVTDTLTLLDFVAVLASDFLALAILILPLPAFHRAYHHIGLAMKVRRALAYVTYVVEPKFKTAEAMLMYLA